MAKLIVTARELDATRQAVAALRTAIPDARVTRTGFRGIISIEAEGDALGLAERVTRECFADIGRATAVLAEVDSTLDEIKQVAVKIGAEHIREGERFCFRLHKRGAHMLELDTPKLEYEIGGAIRVALQQKYEVKPSVDLKNPDVTIVAEVLGPITAVGVVRRAWLAT